MIRDRESPVSSWPMNSEIKCNKLPDGLVGPIWAD